MRNIPQQGFSTITSAWCGSVASEHTLHGFTDMRGTSLHNEVNIAPLAGRRVDNAG